MASTVMSDEGKHTLQNMMKKIVFVDSVADLSRFLCQCCHLVAIVHHVAKCGHVFCGQCYLKIYQRSCPVDECDNVLIDKLTHDVDLEKCVFELKVHCPFTKFGCEEKICLCEYFAHQGSCDYLTEALLSKSQKKTEESAFLQKTKDDILELGHTTEDLQEKLCAVEDTIKLVDLNGKKLRTDLLSMEDRLNSDMEEFVTLELEKRVALQNDQLKKLISEHVSVLQTALETQELAHQQHAAKQELDHQQQIEKQSQEFLGRLQELEKTNEMLRNEIRQLKDATEERDKTGSEMRTQLEDLECRQQVQVKCFSEDSTTEFVWEIPRFGEVLKNLKNNPDDADIESNSFPTMEFGYLMRAKLKCHMGYLSMYVSFMEEDRPGKPLIYFHRRTFIVVDQSNQLEKRDVVRSWEPKFGNKLAKQWMKGYWGSLQLLPISLLEKGQSYLKNDVLSIKIIIEPLATLYRRVVSNDGVLFWKVDDFRKRKQAEIDGLVDGVRSDYFYSHPRGYRLQVELCLNGYGDGNRGEYVAAFVWFRRGEWDDFLSRDFAHRITFTILCQSTAEGECGSLSYSYSYDDIKNRCFSKLALLSKIQQPKYLKNDSLMMQVAFTPISK